MTWQFPSMPSAPVVDVLPDYNNDIEEEMIRAAIEASKRELENVSPDQQFGALNDIPGTQHGQSRPEDADIEHAVSLSLKTAEQEKALRNLQETAGVSDLQAYTPMEVGDRGKRASNGRLDVGSSSLHDEVEGVEEQPLVRNRSRHMSSASIDTADEIGGAEEGLPSSPGQPTSGNHLPQSTNDVHNDEWGGMSSLEHDEAVMLEAALFGGIPEGRGYQFPYAPHQLMQNGLDRSSDLYSQRMPRSPSPGLVTQRLLREQQDDEYLASLQADREKDEARRVEEAAAREAVLEEERKKEEESRKKLEEEQEANEESKSVTKASAMKAIKKNMEKDVDEVGKIARNVKAKIEAISRENLAHRQKPGCGKGTAIDRSRTNMTKQRIQDEYREVVERRVITVTGTRPDEETIDNLIETGNSEQIFQNAMQEMGRGQVSINN